MKRTKKTRGRSRIRDYSTLTGIRKNRFSVLIIFSAIMTISLLSFAMPREVQKFVFLISGIPVIYSSLVLGVRSGIAAAAAGFGIHLYSSLDYLLRDWIAGHYTGVLVENFIIVAAFFLSMLFISKVLVDEREAQVRYRKLAGNYALLVGKLKTANEDITEMFTSTIKALAAAIDAKDAYTKGHSERVTEYAVKVAGELGLSEPEVDHVMYGAIMHDIGKIGIDEKILKKPEPLSRHEYRQVKRHPEIGAGILSSIKVLEPIIPIVLHHHERFDGTGYPAGLRGDKIPIGARIVGVVDAYDALTSSRPYRSSTSMWPAVEALQQESGKQFDPRVLEALIAVLAGEAEQTPGYSEVSGVS
ncbi:HD-GYP domain-containing protein [Phosphitispora fastidiosa]|uniref:HD-GYP domain-containing protein n=1 Tax=Phosphitispora fastidiosa TaxID=2837202 RepID=UPI001E587214|nr:HD-GYP domain-containing protein [Phosphitispora fastidiosa]MBU7005933.1 putative nucleotidyltransferase with HDIG domain [Phosphitispora fastidiosa]